MVVFRPDEVLSEHESLSMATKTMFCEREKVDILNINQQNDKSTEGAIIPRRAYRFVHGVLNPMYNRKEKGGVRLVT